MRKSLIILLLLTSFYAHAGKKVRVLFIGNSYTHVNNMPLIIENIAEVMGDTLVWEMEAPGGFSLGAHYTTNPPTINKIKQGNWDYVVLQEQSQTPAYPDKQVNNGFFPFVRKLDSLIDLHNPCSQTIFYMTWGRKNGDTLNCKYYDTALNWPHFCTYAGMDSVIRLRYMIAADNNKAAVSPAGAVWRYIRSQYPGIELYDPDESHPSAAGSYAVALSFYTAIFRKDPALVSYNYTLNATDAANIRLAAKKVAYDSMIHWHIGQHELHAGFTKSNSGSIFQFTNTSLNATGYKWYFGDGDSSTQANPQHLYSGMGSKTAMLVATNSSTGCRDTFYSKIAVPESVEGNNKNETRVDVYPNPAKNVLNISSLLFLSGSYAIRVYNTAGQMVLNTTSNKIQDQHINLERMANGMYHLSVSGDAGIVYSTQFSKQ